MLVMPQGASGRATILGIDPGTETLGIAMLEFDVQSMQILGAEARTFKGSKLNQSEWLEESQGARFARIHAHCDNFEWILQRAQPTYVASESPFFSRAHPQAYGALTEIVYGMRLTLFRHDPWMVVQYIDPPTVKNAVGAKGNADKHVIKQCLLKLPNLNYAGRIPLESLDEHSIDALAVCYAHYQMLRCLWFNGESLEPL